MEACTREDKILGFGRNRSTQISEPCKKFIQQTTGRNKDETYTVRIPFISSELGNSKTKAASRLLQLVEKPSRNEDLNNGFKQFFREYEDIRHIIK